MSTKKITGLTELSTAPAVGDLLPIVDISDTTDASSGTTKSIKSATIHKAAGIGAGNTTAEPVKIDTSNGRLGVGVAAPSSVCEIAGTGVPFEVTSTNSNGLKMAFTDSVSSTRGYVGATSTHKFVAADQDGAYVFTIGSNSAINQQAYASYNDNDAHDICSIANRSGIIRIHETAGSIHTPYWSCGGAGVAYKWAMLEVDAITLRTMVHTSTFSVTNPGTSGNTYEIKTNGGDGTFSVERTSGALAYTVSVSSNWY